MLLGPQVLGALAGWTLGEDSLLVGGIVPGWALEVWAELPKILISVVFAGLLLGKRLPSPGQIWKQAGPQVLFGYTLAFGQYAIGFAVALAVLAPLFGVNPLVGALIEISLTGGHGTAAGLDATFTEVGFEEGRDLALALATVGVVSGVLIGTLFINYAVRSDAITVAREKPLDDEDHAQELGEMHDHDKSEGMQDDAAADPLTQHLALLGLAIGIGWVLLQGLIWLEAATWGAWTDTELMPMLPLFPVAMIGGVILQLALNHAGWEKMVDRRVVNRICGASLDIIILAAMATISLEIIGGYLAPILILSIVALGWSVFAFWVLAPRMLPQHWFERGLGDFGQSTGMAVTGLLLIRVSDPRNRTAAIETFGYKQLLFEPVVGGGLVTALSLPLALMFGPVAMLVATGLLTAIFIGTGMFLARRA